MRPRQFCVAGDQWAIENLGEDNIGSVVRCDGVSQRPDTLEHIFVLCAFDVESNVVFERLSAPSCGDLFEAHQAAKCLRDLNINQMRGMEALSRIQRPLLHLDAFLRTQQEFEYG